MKPSEKDESPSLASRVLGALTAFVFSVGTTLAIPLALSWRHPVRSRFLDPHLQGWEFNIFFLWAGLVATVAMVIGFIHGAHGVLDIFNLTWETGESHDKETIDTAALFRKLLLITVIVPIAISLIFAVLRT